jgi:hypothetical protein
MVAAERFVSKVSWRGVWAGLFMIAGVQIVMQLFGIAIGVSALNPSQRALESVSLWQGIWSIVSTLSAFFFGGWVAAAMTAPSRRSDGVLMGTVLWAFATTLGIILVSSGLFGAIGIGRNLMAPPRAGQSGIAELHSAYTIGAAWATFATILLSLLCTILGGLIGCGAGPLERRLEPRVEPPPIVPPEPSY